MACRGRQVAAGGAGRQPRVARAGGHPGQAAVHGRRRPGPPLRGYAARIRAVRPRPAADDVRAAAVDHPPVRGILDGGGVERVLPAQSQGRRAGRFRRLRSRDPPRLRLRPPACRRRRGQGRGRRRLGRGHEDPLRRHSARPGLGVDDDERRRAAGARRLHRRRRGAGSRAKGAHRDHPERHPQGVHGPQHVHLPAGSVDPDHRRHHRVHGEAHAEVQLDLDLRLSHAGSRRDAGARAGADARRRQGVRAHGAGGRDGCGRLRGPAVVLLRDRHELLPRGRQAPGSAAAVVANHEGVRRRRTRSR